MTNNRITAFTIMELTVAMLLTALVVGITYTAYQIVAFSYSNFNIKNKDMATLLRMDELLQKDFLHCENITYADKQLVFQDSLRSTKYNIYPDQIIRYGAATDTFKVECNSMVPSFEGHTVDTSDADESQPMIDALRMNLVFQKDTVRNYYIKNYGSQNLIKLTDNANH